MRYISGNRLETMADIAKVFMSGRSQAVRLPREYRFEGREVFIRRDPESGDVILSVRPSSWDGFFSKEAIRGVPKDFLTAGDRQQGSTTRDPFA